MRFTNIINTVYTKPWLITPNSHAAIRRLLDAKLNGEALDLTDMLPEQPAMRIEDGVAIIPIKGVLGLHLGQLEKCCGACGCEDVSANLQAALSNPLVTHILFDVSSPGGSSAGIPELADEIAAATAIKPCMAFTDDECASGAYWLASACTIYASRSAIVGSIGVYLPWVDETRAYEAAGLSVSLIKNTGATYKGAGYPGTALTEDQRNNLQEYVDDIFGMFTSHILASRKVPATAMQGQTFMADAAKKVGLIDEVGNFATALADLKAIKPANR